MKSTKGESKAFGTAADLYGRLLADLMPEIHRAEYRFMAEDEFFALPQERMAQIYWEEILCRAHWASGATLLRAEGWLKGLAAAHSEGNVLSFAACFRGPIESASDSFYTLRFVPATIAQNGAIIAAALAGEASNLSVSAELEDALIHFTHARKIAKGEIAPKSHQAKQVTEYRLPLDQLNAAIQTAYAELCDLTHPGSASVLSFAVADEVGGVIRLSQLNGQVALSGLVQDFRRIATDVLNIDLNGALITLRVLNRFSMVQLHTPGLEKVSLASMSGWAKAEASLRSQGLHRVGV